MNCNISADNGKVGLDSIVYTLKPAKKSNFEESNILEDAFKEPQNIWEDFMQMIKKIKRTINTIIEQN